MKPPQSTGDATRLIRASTQHSRASQPDLSDAKRRAEHRFQRNTPSSIPVEDRATVLEPLSAAVLDGDLIRTVPPPGRAHGVGPGGAHDPDLIATLQPAGRRTPPNADPVATVPPPGRNTPHPDRDSGPRRPTPVPGPPHQARTMLADPSMAAAPHQARTMIADPNQAAVPSAANYAARSFEIPQRNTPDPLPGQPGYVRTLPGPGTPPVAGAQPQMPNAPVPSGIRTSPHMPKRNSSPSRGGVDDLGSRGERPASGKLAGGGNYPAAGQGAAPTMVKTNVAMRHQKPGNNFVLAILVLLAAGIAAAVVYFALPYIT
jgi:hypothetical protein